MLFIDNLNYLREHFPDTYKDWKESENAEPTIQVQYSQAKKAGDTLIIKQNDNELYLHSKYDSFQEARFLIDNLKNVNEYSHAIFYGIGLGYHIQFFHELYPEIPVTAYEPITDIFRTCMKFQRMEDILSKDITDIIIEYDERQRKQFFEKYISSIIGKVLFVELPSYKRIFPHQHEQFFKAFQKSLKERKSNVVTEVAFQKRWILNSIKNFKHILQTPNFLHLPKQYFSQKPAIIVAAGPSLTEEIENLRYIKENGLAYIFAVGKAIRTLMQNGIVPHAACSYDPRDTNYKVFRKIIEEDIANIPLIYGSTVGYELPEKYPGDKIHVLINQDTISSYYFDSQDIEFLNDAPSIAVILFQLLIRVECNPVILVGQNLAHKNNLRYAEGLGKKVALKIDEKERLMVEDVYGNLIETESGFDVMRQQLEMYIEANEHIKVINTTKGGAKIAKTQFAPLDEVITSLTKGEVYDEVFEGRVENCHNIDYLEKKMKRMSASFEKFDKNLASFEAVIGKLREYMNINNTNKAIKDFRKLSKMLNEMEKNVYFLNVIQMMSRIEYDVLTKKIEILSLEKNLETLINGAIEEYDKFIKICKNNHKEISESFIEMQMSIEHFIGGAKDGNCIRKT